MPELRQNFITKEWVIIATERTRRQRNWLHIGPSKTCRRFWKPAHSARATKIRLRPRLCDFLQIRPSLGRFE
jgi:hypothetical protein